MKPTSADYFVDSNIFLYLFDIDGYKKDIAKTVLAAKPVISVQVVSENINVLFKKFRTRLSTEQIRNHKNVLLSRCTVVELSPAIIETAFALKESYALQWYDSMIIAAALEAGCTTLYSEDMQHKLVVYKTLTIINPFV